MTPAPGRGARGGRPGPGDRGRPALAVGVGVVVAALLVSGWSSAGPAGAGEPVAGDRYIDEVFTEVTETSDVVYGEAVNVQGETEQLEMDIFEPTGDAAAARPVLMFLHGGGFTSGDKSSPLIRRLAQSFARRGYVTASVNYRLTDDEEFVVAAIIDA
ncbi:MAG: alpha/beta hydrolase, partial [Actinomycetota bacterium]